METEYLSKRNKSRSKLSYHPTEFFHRNGIKRVQMFSYLYSWSLYSNQKKTCLTGCCALVQIKIQTNTLTEFESIQKDDFP